MLLSVISRVQRGRAELANQIQFTRPLAARNRGRAQVRPPSLPPGFVRRPQVGRPRRPGQPLRLPRSGDCGHPRPQPGGSQQGRRFPSTPGRLRARSGVRRVGRSGPAIMLSTDQLNGSQNGVHSSGVSARAKAQCSVLDMKISSRKA